MSDLISRQDVLDVFRNLAFDHIFQCGEYYGEDERQLTIINAEKAIDVIESLPSAESERKKGKWIDERPNCYTRKVYCSECGQVALNEVKSEGNVYYPRNTFDFALSNYCPNCGAEMIGE